MIKVHSPSLLQIEGTFDNNLSSRENAIIIIMVEEITARISYPETNRVEQNKQNDNIKINFDTTTFEDMNCLR